MYYVQYASYLGNLLYGVGLSVMIDIETGNVIKHYPHSIVGVVFLGNALLVSFTFKTSLTVLTVYLNGCYM